MEPSTIENILEYFYLNPGAPFTMAQAQFQETYRNYLSLKGNNEEGTIARDQYDSILQVLIAFISLAIENQTNGSSHIEILD